MAVILPGPRALEVFDLFTASLTSSYLNCRPFAASAFSLRDFFNVFRISLSGGLFSMNWLCCTFLIVVLYTDLVLNDIKFLFLIFVALDNDFRVCCGLEI